MHQSEKRDITGIILIVRSNGDFNAAYTVFNYWSNQIYRREYISVGGKYITLTRIA